MLEFIDKHLATSGTAVQFQENGFLILILAQYLKESPLPCNTHFKKKMSISQYFRKCHFNFCFPKYKEAFGPKNPK